MKDTKLSKCQTALVTGMQTPPQRREPGCSVDIDQNHQCADHDRRHHDTIEINHGSAP
jgi:hypothetical protein